jgi:hypothetical protein
MIDFADIKARHRIEDLFARRGVEVKRASGGFTAKCPLHDGDSKSSLFIHGTKQYAKCWTRCGYIGSVVDVVMAWDGVDKLRALEVLEGKPLTELEQSYRPRPKPMEKLQFTDGRQLAREAKPLPRMLRADQLQREPEHYFRLIGDARKLHWVGIKMAHDAGCLRFCQVQWNETSEKFNCYAVLDVANPCNVQFRRLDAGPDGKALCFWGDTKVMGWKGNLGNWPVGIDPAVANPSAAILLVEGTGDFLAGWDIRNAGFDVIPVGIFGASNGIAPAALAFFEGREVVIVEQHDAACARAAERWEQQLVEAGAHVRRWRVPEEGADLNDFISAGHSPELIFETHA